MSSFFIHRGLKSVPPFINTIIHNVLCDNLFHVSIKRCFRSVTFRTGI